MGDCIEIILRIVIVIFVIEIMFSPRLDYTHGDQLLLWYGRGERKFYLIYDSN